MSSLTSSPRLVVSSRPRCRLVLLVVSFFVPPSSSRRPASSVVSSRRPLPQRAPFSFARRYLSPSRPRLSSRLSFRFPFRRRPVLRLVVVLFRSRLVVSVVVSSVVPCRSGRRFHLLVATRSPYRLSSRRSVRRCPRFPSHPPPSLRRLISSVVPCRRCGLVRRSVLLAACRLIPRSVPRLVYRSARRRLIRHLIRRLIRSAHFIRRPLSPRAPFRFARRSSRSPSRPSFRRRSVPRLVPSSRPSFIGSSLLSVSSTRWAGRFLSSFDGGRASKQGSGQTSGRTMDRTGWGERGA